MKPHGQTGYGSIDRLWNGDPAREDERASVQIRVENDWLLVEIDAPYHGDPPPPAPPGRFEELWSYEVVELFLVGATNSRYVELEFGPHGHFLALEFSGVRQRLRADLPLTYSARIEATEPSRWRGSAQIPLQALPLPIERANAFAIHGSEDAEGRRYLAASPLGGERPDFHRTDRYPSLDWKQLLGQ